MRLNFSQGVFSRDQFALLLNSRILVPAANSTYAVSEYEVLEVDENLKITLSRQNVETTTLFIYNKEPGNSLENHWTIVGSTVTFDNTVAAFTEVICTYEWNCAAAAQIVKVGSELLKGYVSLGLSSKTFTNGN